MLLCGDGDDDDDDDVAEVVFMTVASSLLTPHPEAAKVGNSSDHPTQLFPLDHTHHPASAYLRAHSPDAGSTKKLSLRLINPITRMVISRSICLPYVSLNPANQMRECSLVDNDSQSPSSHI